MNAKVLEAIKKSAAVPSVPQVVTRFLEIMQDPDFDYDDLVKVLSADAGTVSEILRLVNSALFGIRQKIVSLRQALTLLGPMRTRSLLVGRYLVDMMAQKQVSGLDMGYFWRRSLACSVVASRLADATAPRQRDEAFIGALLADIGVPILAEAMPETFGPIAARYAPQAVPCGAEEELEAVEVTHGEVSAMVLTHWALPDVVTKAVNLHQSLSPGDDNVATIARIIRAADAIARLLSEIPDAEEVRTVRSHVMTFVGTPIEILINLLPSIEGDIEELAAALRIDVLPSKVYAFIAKTVQEGLAETSVAG